MEKEGYLNENKLELIVRERKLRSNDALTIRVQSNAARCVAHEGVVTNR